MGFTGCLSLAQNNYSLICAHRRVRTAPVHRLEGTLLHDANNKNKHGTSGALGPLDLARKHSYPARFMV